MIIGIDMGGTHCDGAVISDGKVLRKEKQLTDETKIKESILSLLKTLTKDLDLLKIKKIHLSTTLVTNALSKSSLEEAGLFLIPGPGMSPEMIKNKIPNTYISKNGSIDHRGMQKGKSLEADLDLAHEFFSERRIKKLAIVSKFSIRNPLLEKQAAKYFESKGYLVFLGNQSSGKLNFPRRAFSTYLRAKISNLYKNTILEIQEGINKMGIKSPVFILKADGGAIPISESLNYPLESVLSGPASSIMGALDSEKMPSNEDCIVLDIGGTTTDLGFFINKIPLLEPEGIEIQDLKTQIRALRVYPAPIGGDSLFELNNGDVSLSNKREGVALSFGGEKLTLTDVFLAIYEKNEKAIKALTETIGAENLDKKLKAIEEKASSFICDFIDDKIKKINSAPIYTVDAFFHRKNFSPKKLLLIGGAAPFFKKSLEKSLKMEVRLLEHHEICNAIGSALSKVTTELNLFANTADGKLAIPELACYENVDRSFSLEKAKVKALSELKKLAKNKGIKNLSDVEITEAESFNMVRGFSSSGKNIRIKAQIKPGLDRA